MTVIRPNSVSGITSITAQANEINFFRSNGALAGLQLNGVNFNTTTGVSTFNNLDVGGVLTYQDVTNVDSLGIGTFRTGINVSGGQLDVGSNIKLGNAGVITATSFVGSGANLTGIDTDLVSDTSPQLGGTLDTNNQDITFNGAQNVSWDSSAADFIFNDYAKLNLGTDKDFKMYQAGNNTILQSDNTSGGVYLQSALVQIGSETGEAGVKFVKDGAVELYHNNTKRLETTSSGVEIPQALFVGEKIDMPDHTSGTNGMILLGTGDDLYMYHDGTNSHLRNNTGTFNVRATNFRLTDAAIQHVYLKTNDSGNNDIQLYYDNNVKLQTINGGISVTGGVNTTGASSFNGDIFFGDNKKTIFGASADLQLYHSGSNSFIKQVGTGDLYLQCDNGETIFLRPKSNEDGIKIINDGAVELYHNNNKKLETTSSGAEVTGKLQLDDGNGTLQTGNYLSVGTGEDLRMFHAGGDSYLRNFGGFFSLGCSNNADLKIVTNGSNRWIFQNDGHLRPDSNNSLDIGTTNYRVRNIYTNDLNLSNKGSTNSVDNTWGDYTIQEGESDLFLINNRNGKKYKFNLTEVS